MTWFTIFWVYAFTCLLYYIKLTEKVWQPTESLIIFGLFFVPVLVYCILEWRRKRKAEWFDINGRLHDWIL